jgi:hypothetical protein
MTLRNSTPAHAPALSQSPGPAAPSRSSRTHQAHRDQPTPSAWPTHATAAATQPANGRPSPSPRPRLELCPPPRACHRLNPFGVAVQIQPLLYPADRHGKLPIQPAPVTAGAYHRRPACALRRWIHI